MKVHPLKHLVENTRADTLTCIRRPRMKKRSTILLLPGILILGLGAILIWQTSFRPDPADLLHWVQAAGQRDWTAQAAQGNPEAQFYLGLTLLRTNLVIMKDSVPRLAQLPVIGKRFQHVSASIDDNIDPDQLREAFSWINKAAEKGHAPARETQRMFAGTIEELNQKDSIQERPAVR